LRCCDVVVSDATWAELHAALHRPKFDRYFLPGGAARRVPAHAGPFRALVCGAFAGRRLR
ncbi:MAG TPA: hypothetical protein VGC24_11965, partial [Burkholderiaceae bacterium]